MWENNHGRRLRTGDGRKRGILFGQVEAKPFSLVESRRSVGQQPFHLLPMPLVPVPLDFSCLKQPCPSSSPLSKELDLHGYWINHFSIIVIICLALALFSARTSSWQKWVWALGTLPCIFVQCLCRGFCFPWGILDVKIICILYCIIWS